MFPVCFCVLSQCFCAAICQATSDALHLAIACVGVGLTIMLGLALMLVIASLKGINSQWIENSIGDLLCYARFTRFWFFLFNSFWIFDFFLRQLFLKFVRLCFGRLDGSIRALRKVRFRNEIDNFIESMSQMVPRWSPDGPQSSQMVPRGPQNR